jgi:hypothetical protein
VEGVEYLDEESFRLQDAAVYCKSLFRCIRELTTAWAENPDSLGPDNRQQDRQAHGEACEDVCKAAYTDFVSSRMAATVLRTRCCSWDACNAFDSMSVPRVAEVRSVRSRYPRDRACRRNSRDTGWRPEPRAAPALDTAVMLHRGA